MDIPDVMQDILAKIDSNIEISQDELSQLTSWYSQSVQKLEDDIAMARIKKEIDTL
jgi:pantothenate kinase-related protein Tda10